MAQISKDGNRLKVQGAMTMENVKALLATGTSMIAADNLEVDLAAVDDVDSSAVSLVFEWLRVAHGRNASLVFVNLPSTLSSLAELYGVLDLIPQHSH